VVVGPFEEEEKGIYMVTYIVKVKGEDPLTSGCLWEDRVARRRYTCDFQS